MSMSPKRRRQSDAIYESVLAQLGDGPSRVLLGRVRRLQRRLPDRSWDGAWPTAEAAIA